MASRLQILSRNRVFLSEKKVTGQFRVSCALTTSSISHEHLSILQILCHLAKDSTRDMFNFILLDIAYLNVIYEKIGNQI